MRDCNLNKEISFHQGVIFAVCELTHYMSPSIHTLRACPPHVLGIHMLAKTPSPCITNERINKAFIRDTGGWFPLWIKERWKLEAVQVGHSYQVSMCSKETGLKPKWKSSLQGKPHLNDVWFTGTHVMCCGYTKKHILMTYKHSKNRKMSYKTTVTLRRKQYATSHFCSFQQNVKGFKMQETKADRRAKGAHCTAYSMRALNENKINNTWNLSGFCHFIVISITFLSVKAADFKNTERVFEHIHVCKHHSAAIWSALER